MNSIGSYLTSIVCWKLTRRNENDTATLTPVVSPDQKIIGLQTIKWKAAREAV
ncbi:hypothetical protein FHS21_005047 [Phyllobacterium trifolii]|uniref:Uncharacterized protein n=1 Tax=Phyllobacterium trifolii TaxID=300193 RepID=A0A839UJ97_9HYPH|nr:hypothetical protein [Phyllobacterium trifolii]MBB3148599.1 hypothetical protein [Phyllobacterium trifolii]